MTLDDFRQSLTATEALVQAYRTVVGQKSTFLAATHMVGMIRFILGLTGVKLRS